MDYSLFARGALFGLAIAAPVGPIGVLCIKRTLRDGQLTGFVSGLGAATADLIYGTIAVLGLSMLTSLLIGLSFWTRLIGGLFLIYLGIRTMREQPSDKAAAATARGLLGAYGSTLLLTITNPATIIAFAAIFAGLGIGSSAGTPGEAFLLIAGVGAGSALWWLMLSSVAGLLHGRLTPRVLRIVNLVSGVIITGFGLAALVSLVDV
ncbi:LysE family translocator [Candidatus Chloroploca sp. Khr17]|uniref:LysE family translocator n=1 Tax=Candidatus Chloroploca sp. Khr17 TaxID=2496869 RepID=UPI00101BE5D4|nr:LysE family transporter [Candidatus Chloroploca sp. Khr17]